MTLNAINNFAMKKRGFNNSSPDTMLASNLWRNNPSVSGDPQIISSTNWLSEINLDEMYGRDIVNYHALLKANVLLPYTPFWRFTSAGSSDGNFSVNLGTNNIPWYYDNGFTVSDSWAIRWDDIMAYAPDGLDYLVQSAASRIYSSGHDTLTFLAELHHVRRQFLDAAKRLATLDFPKGIRSLSMDYLAARYGWRTLLFDIQDISQSLANLQVKRKRYSERTGQSISYTKTTVSTVPYAHFDVEVTLVDSVNISKRGAVTADIDPPAFSFNPIISGWELIPFSFVIDWFVNVGKALSALSFLYFNTTYAAAQGYKIQLRRNLSTQLTNTDKDGQYKSGDVYQTASCDASMTVRQPTSVSSFPQFTIRLDDFKVLDSLALIYQRIR
jgi:hypothetical protein